jgi:citrate synthase
MPRLIYLEDDEEDLKGERIEIPLTESFGTYVFEVSQLPQNVTIYDPSMQHTAPCKSSICFVDGEKGILMYRGYGIEELVKKSSYLEVAYLLIYGDLPGKVTLEHWHRAVMTHAFTHVKLNDLMRAFNYDAHPMGMFIRYF